MPIQYTAIYTLFSNDHEFTLDTIEIMYYAWFIRISIKLNNISVSKAIIYEI